MSMVELIMPRLGESIVEATILKWHKKPGDKVAMDETVLDIATDKVDSEVPSTADGIISEILYNENDVVPVGAVIARIRTSTGESVQQTDNGNLHELETEQISAFQHEEADVVEEVPYTPRQRQAVASAGEDAVRFYSPLVLNIVAREGIPMSELENIQGTGRGGRVSKKDILGYINHRQEHSEVIHKSEVRKTEIPGSQITGQVQSEDHPAPEKPTKPLQEPADLTPPPFYSGNVEIIEMDRTRKMIARHMIESKNVSAHVTSFTECDVTNLVMWRNRIKKDFQKRENEKLTFTPLFIESVIKAIKKYPLLNSSVDGEKIILKKDINIGMATAMPSGNLIVPVIKSADQLSLVGLTKRVNYFADAARNNRLKPDDTSDGTFTITNVGTFGSIMGTPIINQPQVAILATGAIKKRPMVLETEEGDSIAIRHMMYLSLSYDHRIIDGALGVTFLNAIAKELENFDTRRSW